MLKKFEYVIFPVSELTETEEPEVLEKKLNEDGADGWELVAIVELQGTKFIINKKEI